MNKVLLISVLLAFALAVQNANALAVENVSVSETGGLTVSGEASASGSESADADVRSFIRTEGSDTRVHVDIRTSEDGTVRATTTERVIKGVGRFETRVSTDGEAETPTATTSATTSASERSPSRLQRIFDQFMVSLERIFKFIFFW